MNSSFSQRSVLTVSVLVGLILLSYFGWSRSHKGLQEVRFTEQGLPLRLIQAEGRQGPLPGIIICHGFSGSQQLMLGYAYTFAHAGYVVLLPDFQGHGSNPNPMSGSSREAQLQANLEIAFQSLLTQPNVNPQTISILGHSMGSGAILRQSIQHPERYRATVAISPTGRDLEYQASIPPNLLLQAGEMEKPFVRNAEHILSKSGGKNSHFANGSAREMQVIDNVEHISILFNAQSHQNALNWVNQSIGHVTAESYQDRRILWFLVHLLLCIALVMGLAPLWQQSQRPLKIPSQSRTLGWQLGSLVAGPLIGGGLVYLLSFAYRDIETFGQMLVGGSFALWLGFSGMIWLFFGHHFHLPNQHEILLGLLFFLCLLLTFGHMAHVVFLPIWMILERMVHWLWMSLLCLPAFLAMGYALTRANPRQKWLWWLGSNGSLILGLIFLIWLLPALRFMVILIPVIPLITGLIFWLGRAFRHPWTFGLGGALFLAWLIAILFPLRS